MMERDCAIWRDYGFKPVRIIKETEKMFQIEHSKWGRLEKTRVEKHRILPWRGSASEADQLATLLESKAKANREAARALSDEFEAEVAALTRDTD